MLLLRGLRREEGVSARLGQSAVGGATAQSRRDRLATSPSP